MYVQYMSWQKGVAKMESCLEGARPRRKETSIVSMCFISFVIIIIMLCCFYDYH